MTDRLTRLREAMAAAGLPALLVTAHENIYYMSGFSGSSCALLITAEQQYLFTDFRYFLQAEQESPAWTLLRMDPGATFVGALRDALADLGVSPIGFEASDVSFARYQALIAPPTPPYVLQPTGGLVEALRVVKDAEEIATMREAVRLTDAALAHIVTLMRPGVTELELAIEAEWHMRQHGAEGAAFDIIVAAGPRSALPHAEPGERPLQAGDLIVVDMGARYAHYCADMTRSFAIGKASEATREIYRVCYEAQMAGVQGIHAGMTGREADGLVRQVITDAGYGELFGHGTGHGVGLEVHEAPRLSRLSEDVLQAGSTVTIEPGIYLPDIGGVRIEDLVILTASGLEIMTEAEKPAELPILG